MSVLFKGGTIVNATGRYVADVFADGDKIKAIGTDLDNPADEVVDAKGHYILPGAIDPHTHLCMPFMGTYAQDDYETGTIAAACGGVTCVVDFDLQRRESGCGLFSASGGHGSPAGSHRGSQKRLPGLRHPQLQDLYGLRFPGR